MTPISIDFPSSTFRLSLQPSVAYSMLHNHFSRQYFPPNRHKIITHWVSSIKNPKSYTKNLKTKYRIWRWTRWVVSWRATEKSRKTKNVFHSLPDFYSEHERAPTCAHSSTLRSSMCSATLVPKNYFVRKRKRGNAIGKRLVIPPPLDLALSCCAFSRSRVASGIARLSLFASPFHSAREGWPSGKFGSWFLGILGRNFVEKACRACTGCVTMVNLQQWRAGVDYHCFAMTRQSSSSLSQFQLKAEIENDSAAIVANYCMHNSWESETLRRCSLLQLAHNYFNVCLFCGEKRARPAPPCNHVGR